MKDFVDTVILACGVGVLSAVILGLMGINQWLSIAFFGLTLCIFLGKPAKKED